MKKGLLWIHYRYFHLHHLHYPRIRHNCFVCFQEFEEHVRQATGVDWVQCSCTRWLHEECIWDCIIDSNGEERLCPYCTWDFFVVNVLSCMSCVYAKVMHLACAHVVPKALRSFFQIYTVYLGCLELHIGPSPMLRNILEPRYELQLQNWSIIGIGICTCGR